MQFGDIYRYSIEMFNKCIIYKITNVSNGLNYVGCTIGKMEKRFKEHIYRCFTKNYNTKLYNSMRKYGKENFIITLIEECDIESMYDREKYYIKEYDTYNNGLNSTLGGDGCLGYTHSEEIRKKISENIKNGDSHKGKTYDELYGDGANDEREKRRLSVKNGWSNMSVEEKKQRVNKTKEVIQRNSKHSIELVKEIKNKIKNGLKVKEYKKLYPHLRRNFFYELKNGIRWGDVN